METMNIMETFRQEENRRNLIAKTYEEAEKEFKRGVHVGGYFSLLSAPRYVREQGDDLSVGIA